MKFLIGIVVCGLIAALLFNGRAARAADLPASGTVAPDFTLMAQDGKPVNLHDYRGHWVVLYFYPHDFTSGCTLEAHGFQTDLPKYQARNAVILGVSVDSTGRHQDFCTKEGLNFKLLSDADHVVSARYSSLNKLGPIAFSARRTFLIDPQGSIAVVFPKVQPATHSAEVLTALGILQARK